MTIDSQLSTQPYIPGTQNPIGQTQNPIDTQPHITLTPLLYIINPFIIIIIRDDVDEITEHQWLAPPVEQLIQESGKMVFLVELLRQLKQEGHRTLVFSQSRKMLDIIHKVLADKVFD